MRRIRHSPEQIIRKPREADAELAKGVAVPEICKALGIAENTYHRWRKQFFPFDVRHDPPGKTKPTVRRSQALFASGSRDIIVHPTRP